MTAIDLLRQLRDRNVTLSVDGDELAVAAPKGALSSELHAKLIEHKSELIGLLGGSGGEREPIRPAARGTGGPMEFSASFAQQRLWVLHQLAPDGAFFNTRIPLRLAGKLDAGALQTALDGLVARHETLRTTFRTQGGTVIQVIAPPAPCRLGVVDLSALAVDVREAEARRLLEEEGHRPFDLSIDSPLRAQMLRLSAENHVLQLTLHHIISDGWSIPVLYRDLGALYEAACTGRAPTLPPLPIQYADFSVWQRQWLEGDALSKQLAFWRSKLEGASELQLPTDRPRPALPTHAGGHESRELSPRLSAGLGMLSQRQGATPYMVLLAALTVLLKRYTRQDDVVVGSPIANRTRSELEELIGFFVNSLVMRTDVSGDPSFIELLARVRQVALDAYAHQDLPFERLVEELDPERDLSRNPIFQVMFAVQNAPGKASRLAGADLTIAVVPFEVDTTHFDLEVHVSDVAGQLHVDCIYSTELFDAATIRRMLGHYERVLEAVVANPEDRISGMALLDEAERRQVLVEWNETATGYPREASIHELFEAQAARAPEAVAVAYDGNHLSYRELDERSTCLAHHLRGLGVGPEVLVGLYLERSVEMVVGLVGILKAGGAYVPLDPAYPAERLAFMLQDTQAQVVVTRSELSASLPETAARVVCLDRDWPQIEGHGTGAVASGAGAGSLAYVIYTSGSTGTPKGVEVTHRAISRLVCGTDYVDILPTDRLAQASVASFDAATFEIWGALLNGAQVIGVSREVLLSPREFSEFLRARGITVLFLTTALFNQMAREAPGAFRSLRCVLFGGEAVDPDSVRTVLRDGPPQRLLHVYGPTEVTTFSTWHRVAELDQAATTVPIGRPIANTTAYVLDEHRQPVPVGLPGELYLGGDGLARGYLKRPELTAERFVDHPFSEEPGARLYRTGDWVRRLPDGAIEFIGRRDEQVKIRGYRIEPGEIEASLGRHPAVRQAVAMAREDGPGDKRLVAYVTPGETIPSPPELRAWLRERLPEYMVPSAFVVLDRFPLSPNGKVDRGALPAPDGERQLENEFVAPRGRLAATIATVWSDVLGVSRVGAHDNFFDLGGNSLLLVSVHERLQRALDMRFRVVELFQYPTIESLARHFAGEIPAPATVAAARERAGRRHDSAGGFGAIAVIGMAGRFPGADSVEAFWRNLCDGVESIRFFTEDELREAGVDEAVLRDPSYVPARGLFETAEYFDASFFGYTPREAELIDPQQRAFLEAASNALDNAGYDPERYPGLVGVYAGASRNSYLLQLAGQAALGNPQATGLTPLMSDHDFLPTRVSYKLNLRGPSVNIQTACSTSLVAVHDACRALNNHECDMALAGGVSVTVPRVGGYSFQTDGIASPDGHCRPFDADARGTVPGEGVGVVVLKRLDEAVLCGDQVRAVIRGIAVNNDGSGKVGFSAPSVEGQAEVIAFAQAVAGVRADSIGYVEAHGTATALGDPIEVAALNQVFGEPGGAETTCYLGAVKSNVGHLDAAAGVTGLIKTVLALEQRKLPPTLHFRALNPGIDFSSGPFAVNAELRAWESAPGTPRRAGVSSFGMGGTNAHAVLEEAPAPHSGDPAREEQLLVLSARSGAALQAMAARLADCLETLDPATALADVAHTLQVGRRRFAERRALVVRGRADAIEQLRGGASRLGCAARAGERAPDVVFMFPGQGAQYPGMGRLLYAEENAFRATVDACCEQLRAPLGFDLRTLLFPAQEQMADAAERLRSTSLTQPALFVIEYALAQQWIDWGIRPQAMIGHSIGEYVAACVAGVMTLDDALMIVAERGRLMESLPRGAMLGVALPEEKLGELLDGQLSIASVNGPGLCVVSGPEEAIESLAGRLQEQGVEGQRLHTSHAFHSAMMEPVLESFARRMRSVALSPPGIAYVSNLTGTWISAAEATDPDYYARHLRATVRFSQGLEALFSVPERVLLEVGPGRTLGTLATRHSARPAQALVVSSLPVAADPHGDAGTVLLALGRLWATGIEPAWPAVHGRSRRRRIALPAYPFERRPYLIESRLGRVAVPALGKRADLGTWFYQPSWKRVGVLDHEVELPAARWLLFMDRTGIGESLKEALAAKGSSVICVRESAEFEQRDSAEFGLCAADETHYVRLFDRLRSQGELPERIAHLWLVGDCGEGDADAVARGRDAGFFSITYLVRALAAAGAPHGAALLVLTNGLHDVVGNEPVCPGKALVLGPCRVIEAEYPGIRCRAIDLEAGGMGPGAEGLARALSFDAEDPARLSVVAYRGNYRWALGTEPVAIGLPKRPRPPVRDEGTYLITGGLGGMGLAFADHLARSAHARLVLVGRNGLPPREAWDEYTATAGTDDATRMRIEAVQAMEAAGGQVMTCAADVSDRVAMSSVIAEAKRRFGRIHGVIHAAGIPGGGVLERLNPAVVEPVFAPKVLGTRILDELLRDDALDFLLLCSSLISFLGFPGRGEYTAANAYVDAYGRAAASRGRREVIVVNWDTWTESGMAVGGSRPAGERNDGMRNAEGVEVLRRVLEGTHPQVVVSVRDFRPREIEALYARGTTASGAEDPDGQAVAPTRRYARPPLTSELAGSRDDTEAALVEIWQDLLGIEPVGIHDNFFELGGDSVLGLQIVARARQAGLELRAKQIFEHQSIAELAAAAVGVTASLPQAQAVTGAVPLTPIQCWFFEQELARRDHFNQSILLRVPESLDPQRLARALLAVETQHDALRCRYRKDGASWRQRIEPPGQAMAPLTVDLSDLGESEQPRKVTELCVQLETELDLESGPLLRAGYFVLGPGRGGRLALIVHHLVVDAVSWPILIEDLQAAYAQLGEGAPEAKLGPKTTSVLAWSERLAEFAASATLAQELSYWRAQRNNTVRPLPRDFTHGDNDAGSVASISAELTEAETRALALDVHGVYDTRVPDLLLAALWQSVFAWSGQSRIAVGIEGHGRDSPFDDVDLSRTVGWFTSMYPVFLEGPPGGEPEQLIPRIREQLGAVPNNGTGFGILRYLCPRQEVRAELASLAEPEIVFLYLGKLDAAFGASAQWAPAPEPGGAQRDPRNRRRHLFEVSAAIRDGRLMTNWIYSSNCHRDATVRAMVERFVDALRALVAHCGGAASRGKSTQRFTAGHLTRRELDNIRSQLGAKGTSEK